MADQFIVNGILVAERNDAGIVLIHWHGILTADQGFDFGIWLIGG